MTATALRCCECGLTFGVFGTDELTTADAYLQHRATHRRDRGTVTVGSAKRHPSGGAA